MMFGAFFWSSLEFGEKLFNYQGRLFFGLDFICLPEKSHGRGSSPSMLSLGQNWGKIANYPPQCSTKIGTPVRRASLLMHGSQEKNAA